MLAAWPGLAVEGNLTVQIAALRRVLGEEPSENRWIETLPRRGYRFIGLVDARGINGAQILADGRHRSASYPFPISHRLQFCRCRNLSGDPEQEYLADRMVEEIITALSRIRWLFVIAGIRASSTRTISGRKAGRARAWCAIRPRRFRSARRGQPGSASPRSLIDATNWRASRGPITFDGSLEDVSRSAGPGGDQRRRGHRASIAGRGNPASGGTAEA